MVRSLEVLEDEEEEAELKDFVQRSSSPVTNFHFLWFECVSVSKPCVYKLRVCFQAIQELPD